jgi:2-iminobutanoate/2-iminopropanoate deaminase
MHLTRITILAAAAVMGLPCTVAAQRGQMAAPEFISAGPNAPFSQAVRVGRTIYLSGMLGMTADGQLATGGIQAETRQTLENIKAALQPLGATMDDVVKCTVFLADMAEWPAMNEVYVTFFPTNKPARSAVAVSGLARNARVEIECIAVRR